MEVQESFPHGFQIRSGCCQKLLEDFSDNAVVFFSAKDHFNLSNGDNKYALQSTTYPLGLRGKCLYIHKVEC